MTKKMVELKILQGTGYIHVVLQDLFTVKIIIIGTYKVMEARTKIILFSLYIF